jgi:hypothetical protein
MARRKKRSSREIRKPKQLETSPALEVAFGNQIKLAANTDRPNGKAQP